MKNLVFERVAHVFDTIRNFWESHRVIKVVSLTLVTVFVLSVIVSYLDRADHVNLGKWDEFFANPFFAIEISFTLLLILELLSLIFVLSKSVARSVGKQFELLSLIFVRSGFKEFSHIENFQWDALPQEVINMFVYAFGALFIFVIIGATYRLQMHSKLTGKEDDEKTFIQSKKLLAILLLGAFLVIGFYDTYTLFITGNYLHSFDKFYTVLIFSDIIIVLIALRYTMNYYRIFRYSAFVLATIFIRISLSTEVYLNVIIGIGAALFIFLLTLTYNYFLKNLPPKVIE